jgi:hypothetical protein
VERSYYEILQVSAKASTEEIKRAYRRLALIHHPDIRKGQPDETLRFLEIKEAYETLIDPIRRKAYDNRSTFSEADPSLIFSFYVTVDKVELSCFEELRVSFTYTGEGRFFKKPDFRNFFITGVPYVSIRRIIQSNTELKETTLSYIVCPLLTGNLVIDRAAIKIRNKSYFTEPVKIHVTESKCFFSKNRPADGQPYRYPMYYEATLGADKIRRLKNLSHTVLIPRSAYAYSCHRITRGLKLVMMVWGIILCLMIKKSVLIGLIAGLSFGGLMGNILYVIAGVKPVFRRASKYKTVLSYLEKRYQTGTDSGSRFLKSRWLYDLERLIF